MSDKTEARPLSLADQALAGLPAHTNERATYQGQLGYWVQAEAKFVPCSNPGTAITYYRQRLAAGDIAVDHNLGTACVGRIKLFAEHERFRQQVAAELREILKDPTEHLGTSYDEESYWVGVGLMQDRISAFATRLGLEL